MKGELVVGVVGGDLLVVAAERFAVHVEEEHTGSIGVGCDNDVLFRCWVRGRWEWEVWGCLAEIILPIVSVFTVFQKLRADHVHFRTCCRHKELPSS